MTNGCLEFERVFHVEMSHHQCDRKFVTHAFDFFREVNEKDSSICVLNKTKKLLENTDEASENKRHYEN